ncbi:CHAT domain-containing protein [Paracoccus benzoatiresistens]|uniref:CHAT domain-containing protein n=1 Tax=Paracoccus benzoatiresistens TaxID=2997341 RepID=A0ABT4J8Q7_9RHOB|nr:CHAT domain-containing protein [Paracoccus sp. EF6]MCZ0963495.1 CHAT domain-containing protein [Paracoccus sp. EF6]
MLSTSYKSQIDTLLKRVAGLRDDQRRHSEASFKAAQNAQRKREQAAKSRSASSARSYLQQADQDTRNALAAEKRANDCAKKIADIESQVTSKQKSLQNALKQESDRADQALAAKQRASDRETQRRRQDELKHARELAKLARPEVRHVMVPAPQPEKLRILYLTANPDREQPLRTEAEVSSVLRELRGTKYRDHIDLQVRPAATPKDLLDGINDIRPHVIHFSGHGDDGLLAFDNASLDEPDSVIVEFDLLAELLNATDRPPTLLVMNACRTLHGSDVLLEAVPVLIGMEDSVGDAAAGVFATQFYSAIASGQPIGVALRQAKVALKLALMKQDAELPQLISREDVDTERVSLVSDQGVSA